MSIAEWHAIFNIVFIVFAIVLVGGYVLSTANEFVKNYKKMKARARRYERLIKTGGKLYV